MDINIFKIVFGEGGVEKLTSVAWRAITGVLRRRLVRGLLVAVAVALGAYAVYDSVQGARGHTLAFTQYLFILAGLLAPWIVVLLGLACAPYGPRSEVEGKSGGTSHGAVVLPSSATGGQYDVPSRVKAGLGDIDVRRLHGLQGADPLELDWTTFSDGIEFLIKQLKLVVGGGPDLVVGINNAGGAMAALLAGKFGMDSPLPVGIVITKGGHCPYPDSLVASLPHVVQGTRTGGDPGLHYRVRPLGEKGVKCILVVDMMVRKGNGICAAVNLLRQQYHPQKVLVAELVATRVKQEITNIRELKEGLQGEFCINDEKLLPDFLAFTCSNKTVRLPHNIQ
ncbi:MAG: hypothetical protein JW955_03810 [Sedimentisphaerales bacterium]|nr:hypothetical protein [Sedimentisphaerales bacterium]